MPSESYLDVVEGKEFDIILKGDGIGGHRWFADHDMLEHFGKNYIGRNLFSNSVGIGGGAYVYYTFKFDNCDPPLHNLTFIKKRPWGGDVIVERHSVIVTVHPTPNNEEI